MFALFAKEVLKLNQWIIVKKKIVALRTKYHFYYGFVYALSIFETTHEAWIKHCIPSAAIPPHPN